MATVEELIRQYETDPELQKEVNDILADGKITIREFMTFTKNHFTAPRLTAAISWSS